MQGQQPRSKSEWKRLLGKDKLKEVKREQKQHRKQRLHEEFETQVGADGDDGAQTIGKKDKERMLREVSKRWQWRMTWLSRLTWAAILVLAAWGASIVISFRVDPAVRLVIGLSTLPAIYHLATRIISRNVIWHTRRNLQGGHVTVHHLGLPLFATPPFLLVGTLVIVHLAYQIASLIGGDGLSAALIGAETNPYNNPYILVELVMTAAVGFGLAAVFGGILPTWAVQNGWVCGVEGPAQWKGEMVQLGTYAVGALAAAVSQLCFAYAQVAFDGPAHWQWKSDVPASGPA